MYAQPTTMTEAPMAMATAHTPAPAMAETTKAMAEKVMATTTKAMAEKVMVSSLLSLFRFVHPLSFVAFLPSSPIFTSLPIFTSPPAFFLLQTTEAVMMHDTTVRYWLSSCRLVRRMSSSDLADFLSTSPLLPFGSSRLP